MLVQYLLSCPSVRLSQVGVLLRRLNLWSHKQSRMICPETLTPKICWKFQWGQPERSLYLRNDARYGRQIGTPMHSIEWHNFQWPWVTLTHDLAPFSTFSIVFCIFVTSGDGNLADVLILSGASPRITNHPWKGRGLAICLRYSYNWTDLNQTWTHIPVMTAIWKKLVQTLRAFTHHGKNVFLGPTLNFDRTYLTTEHGINNRKESCQSAGTPLHAPKIWWTLVQKGLRTVGEFLPTPPPIFLHWETLPALPHGRYITDSRQTLAIVV